MPNKPKAVNLNDPVWMRLTPAGLAFVQKNDPQQLVLAPDEHGCWTGLLWEWMALFGPAQYNGMQEALTEQNVVYFKNPAP